MRFLNWFLKVGIVGILLGCVTSRYYVAPNRKIMTDEEFYRYYLQPDGPGYYDHIMKGICNNCGRIFTFSPYHYFEVEKIKCPYCGYVQDTKMAWNRYVYELERQKAVAEQRRRAWNAYIWTRYQREVEESRKRFYEQWRDMMERHYNRQTIRGTLTPNPWGGYDFQGEVEK